MSEEVIKVLDALSEKFGLVMDWTSSDIIPYLEQLCNKHVDYDVATSIVWLLLGLVCLFMSIKGIKLTIQFCNKYENDPCSDYDVLVVFVGAVTGVLFIVGVVVSLRQIFDIVTCFTFPEKVIIEELKSMYLRVKSSR